MFLLHVLQVCMLGLGAATLSVTEVPRERVWKTYPLCLPLSHGVLFTAKTPGDSSQFSSALPRWQGTSPRLLTPNQHWETSALGSCCYTPPPFFIACLTMFISVYLILCCIYPSRSNLFHSAVFVTLFLISTSCMLYLFLPSAKEGDGICTILSCLVFSKLLGSMIWYQLLAEKV